MRRIAILAVLAAAAPFAAAADKHLLWGDTHLHTSNSFDAITIGNRTIDPAAAYRYARGLPVVHPYHGARVQIGTPLDFLVVSDHAEFLGVVRHVYEDWVPTQELGLIDTVYAWFSALVIKAGVGSSWGPLLFGSRLPTAEDPREAGERLQEEGFKMGGIPPLPAVSRATWVETTAAADAANEPGTFSALIGWEWSSNNGGANLHRIVITDSGAEQAQRYLPFSFLDSSFPEDLWAWLDATSSETGADFIAIPHNSNISKGYMFDTRTLRGNPLSAEYAAARMRWEQVVEVTQIKGDSETHPDLSPDDAFADFETFPFYIQRDRTPYLASQSDYIRSALRLGLELQQDLGQNPYQFGLIGSSDAHSGLAGAEEDNFHGKFAADSIPANKEGIVRGDAQGRPKGWNMSASGLAAVWAEENTREAIVAALKRREVYATSGPRIGVRFFAGSGYSEALLDSARLYQQAVASGVPMGGELHGAYAASPEFLVIAEKEADGANLDRIQIIKGWLDDEGRSQEQVFDVAWSGDRRPDAAGNLPAVGDTVDAATASYSNTIGSERLAVRWRDPQFQPHQQAFYYARVLQIPTPRHSLYDAVALQRDISGEFDDSIQERAYTSPIWYRP
ncbi:DUF3604 domain-containing protein [Pseudohalioglobus lutimaris]|uniref:DUF3604 domain-containing protein n=1 Tax=Pseudohalioglobus lutimaris TaxID=1737061 RepID=A0A2N5X6I5_9GAMM|nr:DUF3604 domain-containing protein [Pseudohalioglobus lutimaris]PLW70101.1 DUF3604 domain-containing protein [Pseudohalioglobus lutimaris]